MSREKADERINSRLSQMYKSGKKNRLPVIIPVILAVVVCLVAGVTVCASLNKKENDGVNDYNVVVTPENVSQLAQQMRQDDYVPVGTYEVNMNSEWIFPDGDSASTNAYVGNNISNKNSVYFTVTLDDGTEVMKSPVIPAGSHLKNIRLNTKLVAGTYDAVVKYYLLDSKGENMSHVSVSIKMTIQK